MKIQVLSDTHWEYLSENEIPDIEASDSDLIILAGDINNGIEGIRWAASQQKKLLKPIVYVAGNHEYYKHDYYQLNIKLKQFAKKNNIFFLQNNSVVINNVRILGATLWTNYGNNHPGLINIASYRINDHRYITADKWWQTKRAIRVIEKWLDGKEDIDDYRRAFLPHTALDEHKKSIRWLKKQLEIPFSGKTVVVTHHAPSFESLKSLVYLEQVLNPERWVARFNDSSEIYRVASYASDLTEIITKYSQCIDLWIHGHTHASIDYAIKGVRVVANARGYPVKSQSVSLTGKVSEFDPVRNFDLEQGIAPAIMSGLNESYKKWELLIEESYSLEQYIKHTDPEICDLAIFRLIHYIKAFNKISEEVVFPVLSNLNPKIDYEIDSGILCRSNLFDADYSLPRGVSITDFFIPGREKTGDFFDKTIISMKDIVKFLSEWIEKTLSEYNK